MQTQPTLFNFKMHLFFAIVMLLSALTTNVYAADEPEIVIDYIPNIGAEGSAEGRVIWSELTASNVGQYAIIAMLNSGGTYYVKPTFENYLGDINESGHFSIKIISHANDLIVDEVLFFFVLREDFNGIIMGELYDGAMNGKYLGQPVTISRTNFWVGRLLPPETNVKPGFVDAGKKITLSCKEGETIIFTTDGSDPMTSSTKKPYLPETSLETPAEGSLLIKARTTISGEYSSLVSLLWLPREPLTTPFWGLDVSLALNGEHFGDSLSEGETRSRLAPLAKLTKWIRTYGSLGNGLPHINKIAKEELNLRTMIGLYITNNETDNNYQIDGLRYILENGPAPDLITVGNECSLLGVTQETLKIYIDAVRELVISKGLIIPIGCVDIPDPDIPWSQPVLDAIDYIGLNIFSGTWDRTPESDMFEGMKDKYALEAARFYPKMVLLTETGTPYKGDTYTTVDGTILTPNITKAVTYLDNFLKWIHNDSISAFYFSAFDEPIKKVTEGFDMAQYFGIMDGNLNVHPFYQAIISKYQSSKWNPIAASTEWNDAANWTNGIPKATTNVIITKAANYPVLNDSATVATILFEPGAELGRQDLLTYDKAYVEYDFGTKDTRSARYRMLSVPLKEVYPGDFTFGKHPTVYIQTLEVTNGTGKWVTVAGGNKGALSAGTGFVISLKDDEVPNMGLGLTGGILQLPYYDNPNVAANVHKNHTFSGGMSTFTDPNGVGAAYTVPRTADGHKLAGATDSIATGFGTIGESPFALVGNPFMTTIDFNELQSENDALIKKSYHVWTEVSPGVSGYICYSSDGLFGIINSTDTVLDELIAPLQGFIVEQNTGAGNLNFNLETIASGTKGTLRSAQETNNKLDIIASNDKVSVLTYIAKREDGTEQFGERDSRKLTNGLSEVPEIYTLKPSDNGLIATGANITNSDDIEYPLGFATTFEGEITFKLSGMDSYDAKIFFIDRLSDKTIELTDMSTYEYTFDYTPPQNGAEIISTNDRFFIKMSSTASDEVSNEITDEQPLYIYANQGIIHAVSNEATIREINIYSLQGMALYQSNVNNKSHATTKRFIPGVYIVNIKIDNNIISKKIIISQ